MLRKSQNSISTQRQVNKIKNTMLGWVLFIPTFLLFYLIILRPIISGAINSFFDMNGYNPVKFVGLKNYVSVLTNSNFLKTLLNTLKYVAWSLIIGFPLPIIAAIMINELIHFKNTIKTLVYLPAIVPAIAVYMLWAQLYQPSDAGILNMILSKFGMAASQWLQNPSLTIILLIVATTWQGFGSTSMMYLATLQGINQELYEAATLDGANLFNKFRYILLPELYGVALLFAIKQIIGVFQIIEMPMAMTGGGPDNASMSMGLMMYNYGFVNNQFDKALAMGFIMFCILIMLTFVYFFIDKKLSAGE